MKGPELYQHIIAESSFAAMEEVRNLLQEIATDFPSEIVERDFWLAVSLYRGEYPGFRSCNTEYHNLFHARQTFLAMARLLHGAACTGEMFPVRDSSLALTAAIFHDSGYLQEEVDHEGTGAKYTRSHVSRSVALLYRLQETMGYAGEDLAFLEAMILSTDLAVDCREIPFPSAEARSLGQLLDAADLLAQMSDRNYLEKLLFLFHEFREAGIRDYASEADLLRKTIGFYQLVENRLRPVAFQVDRYMRAHFHRRHCLDINPYHDSMRRQRDYLQEILRISEQEPQAYLRRGGIVDKVRDLYAS